MLLHDAPPFFDSLETERNRFHAEVRSRLWRTLMGGNNDEKNVIVGVCDGVVQAMIEKCWLRPVPGAGNAYLPTSKGRRDMQIILNTVVIRDNHDGTSSVRAPGCQPIRKANPDAIACKKVLNV